MRKPNQAAMTERAIAVQYLRQIAQKSRRLARKILGRGEAAAFDLQTAAQSANVASILYQAAMDLEHGRHRENAPHLTRGSLPAKKGEKK